MDAESQTPPAEKSPTESSLQFDRAEFVTPAAAALSCEVCKTPLQGEYYQVNGKSICPACRTKIDAAFGGGSSFARFGKAAIAGLAGGLVGFLAYWAVRALFGIQLSLIAILVGWLVGSGVRWGAHARGGLIYQIMAALITYVAICSSYIPDLLSQSTDPSLPLIAKGIIAFFIALAVPFLRGVQGIMGWIIIAIGLYQAWIMNRKAVVQITGPYFTSKPPAA